MVNIRQKGFNAEREVVRMLNEIINTVIAAQSWDDSVVSGARDCIQRNQQQSAVGGSDLTGVFGMAIEIKRHETLHINQWWLQCTEAAKRNNEHPVLLFRQSNQKWTCVTLGSAPLPGGRLSAIRVQFDEATFRIWFYQWVYYKMIAGEIPRI
jgi:hypothetical protein